MTSYDIVGKSVNRKDALEKVMGTAIYACDLDYPDQLYAATVRSTKPFAKVLRVDATEALKIPGVNCVLTYKDIPGSNSLGIILKDEFVLAEDVVRRVGDAIALVAASSQEIAEEAAKKVKVEYKELKPIFSIEEALSPVAAKIHPNGNILLEKNFETGNIDEAFKNCDVIVEGTYETPMLSHMFLETEAGIARMEKGIMTVYCCCQNPHFVRSEVARVLGFPLNKVRCVQTTTGGGFGGKLDVGFQCHLALLSFYTGKAVKLVRSRKESSVVSAKRHPFIMKAKTGATKEGKVLACDVDMISDGGAYASYAPAVASRAIMHFMGPYEIPNIRGKLRIIYTNNPVAGAFRGFGMPQVALCHEGQMNALARKLNMDPIELRIKNAHHIGTITSSGQLLKENVAFIETLESAREKAKKVLDGGWNR